MSNQVTLTSTGVYLALALAQKYSLPAGKVIDLLNDFINFDPNIKGSGDAS